MARTVALSRFSALAEGVTIIFRPSRVRRYEKRKAQKMRRPGLAHSALLRVDLEPHAPLEEIADRGHDALSGAPAAHEDIAVSRPKEFHLRPLSEPYVTLSRHTAPIVRPRP
jgi:hypothetical protein